MVSSLGSYRCPPQNAVPLLPPMPSPLNAPEPYLHVRQLQPLQLSQHRVGVPEAVLQRQQPLVRGVLGGAHVHVAVLRWGVGSGGGWEGSRQDGKGRKLKRRCGYLQSGTTKWPKPRAERCWHTEQTSCVPTKPTIARHKRNTCSTHVSQQRLLDSRKSVWLGRQARQAGKHKARQGGQLVGEAVQLEVDAGAALPPGAEGSKDRLR